MGIEDLIAWYQKKIGAYDKQQWEKTIEQNILFGLNNIQLKSAKPKTDLIDLDLFRGSSFTKAKSKHSFVTVARLSTLRFIFLPIYSKWWVQQTSGVIFGILLLLYLLQLFNIGVYSYNTSKLIDNTSQNVPTSEIFVPIIMMWVLSFVHSTIVATTPGPESNKIPFRSKKSFKRNHRRSRKHAAKIGTDSVDASHSELRNRRKNRIVWKKNLETNLEENQSKSNVEVEENIIAGPSRDVQQEVKKISNQQSRRISNGQPLDDDGFESLNGNGSSHSDNGEEPVVPKKSSRKSKIRTNENKALNEPAPAGISRCNEWVKEIQEGTRQVNRRQSAPNVRCNSAELESDSDTDTHVTVLKTQIQPMLKRRNSQIPLITKSRFGSTCDTDEDGECETLSSPETIASGQDMNLANDWIGITTNSDDCSYSSEFSESDDNIIYDIDAPTSILSPCCGPSDRVTCSMWDRTEIKTAELSVLEISSVIISRVDQMPTSMDYFYIGIFVTTTLSIVPILCRYCDAIIDTSSTSDTHLSFVGIVCIMFEKLFLCDVLDSILGTTIWERTVMLTAAFQRWVLGFMLFFILIVAERSFKQRFLYAKLFSHLTSSRKARKSELPHFRLNKVRNIKTWLSVRSYLKKRGPQRSIDVIVSTTFIIFLMLLSVLCWELLEESISINSQYNLEMLVWSIGLGILIMRFMTLGVKINEKYRNLSVLITEQINLYLQIEQKPKKKDELMVANSVLKLAADLLKELESQFKIFGLSANPLLYNITKVVILSALSGVLSEILGFKLKLHKIKIK